MRPPRLRIEIGTRTVTVRPSAVGWAQSLCRPPRFRSDGAHRDQICEPRCPQPDVGAVRAGDINPLHEQAHDAPLPLCQAPEPGSDRFEKRPGLRQAAVVGNRRCCRLGGGIARGRLSSLQRRLAHAHEKCLLVLAREGVDRLLQRQPFHRRHIVHQLARRIAGRPHSPELHDLQLAGLSVRHRAEETFDRNIIAGLFHHLAPGAGQSILAWLELAFRQHPRLILSQPDDGDQGGLAYHDPTCGQNRRADFRRLFHAEAMPDLQMQIKRAVVFTLVVVVCIYGTQCMVGLLAGIPASICLRARLQDRYPATQRGR